MSLLDSLSNFGKNKMPSLLKDPFGVNKISRIYVTFNEPFFQNGKWRSHGSIEFKNGNTKGEQTFDAEGDDAFDQVVLQMREFIKELQK